MDSNIISSFINSTNALCIVVNSIPELSWLVQEIQSLKICFFIDKRDYLSASAMLRDSEIDPKVQVLALRHIEKKVRDLFEKNQVDNAIAYLSELEEQLSGFNHYVTVLEVLNYLKSRKAGFSSSQLPANLIQTADALDSTINITGHFSWLQDDLLSYRFYALVSTHQFNKAKAALDRPEISAKLRSELTQKLILFMINKGASITSAEGIDETIKQISLVAELFKAKNNKFIQCYLNLLAKIKFASKKDADLTQFANVIQAFERLFELFSFASLEIPNFLRSRKAECHIQIGKLEERAGQLPKALVAYASAYALVSPDSNLGMWLAQKNKILGHRTR